jgi:uncharacterized membrane protein YsdA (DUF1294 family)
MRLFFASDCGLYMIIDGVMASKAALGTVYYLSAVNIGSVALFGYDKFQAQNGGWRVSEKHLCQSALLGGWIGGLIAMQLFRHKTYKQVSSPAASGLLRELSAS